MNQTLTHSALLPPPVYRAVPWAASRTAVSRGDTGTSERRRWLRQLRETHLRQRTGALTSCPTVLVYVLVRSSEDPGGRLAVARAHALSQGLNVAHSHVDDLWRTDPDQRPILAHALAAIRRREADGLVCVSRTDISSSDELYEHTLHLLHGAAAFLSLKHAETGL
ncbi:hypothetical protein SMD44_p10126 (plasmid) [Streptomyces alboflavus]|uniref:Resolvase/invertase-type recombinase catalytic domain-containing protein n=1 Tax=Streptomyces alboflavus TaxID=67267 RepID=A0A291W3C0_9ACTN|nr:hypothetical protein [Streptomyces alboflavus]ATM24625.1 hypothetical protein SMD44_p10126 [Streptomyces alboflavus]